VYTRRSSLPAMRRTIIIRCLFLTIVLAVVTLTGMTGASITLTFLPLPTAWLIVRVSTRAGLVSAAGLALAFGAAGFAVHASTGGATLRGDLLAGVYSMGMVAAVAGCVGWMHAQVALGRRWQGHALTAVCVAWLIAVFSFTAIDVAARGFDGVRSSVRTTVEQAYLPQLDTCRGSRSTSRTCVSFRDEHDAVISAINDHGRLLLWPFVALLALVCAAISLSTFRALASRAGLPVQRAIRLREVEAPWFTAYVLAAGLALVMVASLGGVPGADLVRIVGYTLTMIGGVVLVVQAVAVTVWTLHRFSVRKPMQVLFWVSVIPLWVLYVPIMLMLGLWDLSVHFRRKALNADNITRARHR